MIDPATFRAGMRRLAAGVSIVTTIEDGAPHGFVATAVSSVSAEPHPSLLICVNRGASTHDRIDRTGIFCVNLLATDDQDMAAGFAAASRERRFEDPRWTTLASGAPALSSALATFDCTVLQAVPVHSHTVFIGEVRDVRLWGDEIAPLLYIDGRFGGLATASL